MAEDTIAFLGAAAETPVQLLGCSDGAVVALCVAVRRPDPVLDLVIAGRVHHRGWWEPGAVEDETEVPDFMVDAYGQVSPDGRGPGRPRAPRPRARR